MAMKMHSAAHEDKIIQALALGEVVGVRGLLRKAGAAKADSQECLDELEKLTAAIKSQISSGTIRRTRYGRTVRLALTDSGRKRAKAKAVRCWEPGWRSKGVIWGAVGLASLAGAGCMALPPEQARMPLMGFPTPVGLQQVRGDDGQTTFQPCNPCAAPTRKTPILADSNDTAISSVGIGKTRNSADKGLGDGAAARPAKPPSQASVVEPDRQEREPIAVLFGFAQSRLTSQARLSIASFARTAKAAKVIHVRGQTDSQGDPIANEVLAKNRAAMVRAELVSLGVERRRISVSHCTTCYVQKNDTAHGRQANRRVELSME